MSTELGHPLVGLGRGAVVDGDRVACLGQVTGHVIAHDAKADERHIAGVVAHAVLQGGFDGCLGGIRRPPVDR